MLFLQVPQIYYKTLREQLIQSQVKIKEDLDMIEVLLLFFTIFIYTSLTLKYLYLLF